MGFGYGGQYICQSYEPLFCGVICSENYGLEEKTQDNIFALAEVCYECRKCVEPSKIHVENPAQFFHQYRQEKQV